MQGTFDDADALNENADDQLVYDRCHDNFNENDDNEEYTDTMNVRETENTQTGKRFSLSQIIKKQKKTLEANVPWEEHMTPSNSKKTQRFMADHREREIRFNALPEEKKQYRSRVVPYPETPDKIYPPTPCYKFLLNGRYIKIFVIEEPALPWDGGARPQTQNYWIVSHFLYRQETGVNERKQRYKAVYDHNARLPGPPPPPDKFDFNSTVVIPPLPNANINDCYYEQAQDNPNLNAPQIVDPIFSIPFNTLPGAAIQFRRPYPYDQPKDIFPQQPNPPVTMIPNPAFPGAPAAGGRGRGRGGGAAAAIPRFIPAPPNPALIQARDPTYHGRDNIDWVMTDPNNIEIGSHNLKEACEQAEELDYNFALSMQGLKGATLHAVWNCTDPQYDMSDRKALIAQFTKLYMDKFYSSVSVHGPADTEEVVEHALSMHEDFCKGWVAKHHRNLSAEVTAASEALVGMFYQDLKPTLPVNVRMTQTHISRYLRRHPDYSSEFAHCLYHYMTSLEQMRGNRNPSYRAMQNERLTNITAIKKMASILKDRFEAIRRDLSQTTQLQLIFHPWFIDWHYVASQLPAHHREFTGYAMNYGGFATRSGGRGNPFPPWQQMRFAR